MDSMLILNILNIKRFNFNKNQEGNIICTKYGLIKKTSETGWLCRLGNLLLVVKIEKLNRKVGQYQLIITFFKEENVKEFIPKLL